MKKFALALALPLALAACGSSTQSAVATAQTTLAGVEVALTAAERAALAYAGLPRCPSVVLCSQQATVDAIKAADQKAYAALKAAKTDVALVSEAQAALAVLVALVPTSAS